MALLVVLLTAALIHVSWSLAARQNVRDVVAQLNREIIGSIHRNVVDIFNGAMAMQEALRTIFFQGVIEITDEGARECVFLSLLQSQPSVSWVAFGWPDGNFFGSQKFGDDEIRMVEVKPEPSGGPTRLRVDRYAVTVDDIVFQERSFTATGYRSTDHGWYRAAVAEPGPHWTPVSVFPTRVRPAVATSLRLEMYQEFVGIMMVAIDLDRLSRYLAFMRVGDTGRAYIVSGGGDIVALPDIEAIERERSEMPTLATTDEPLLKIARAALLDHGVSLADVARTRTLEISHDGGDYFVTVAALDFLDWRVITVVPGQDFLAAITRTTRMLIVLVAVLTIAIAILAALFANRLVVVPLQRIVGQLGHIATFRLDRITFLPNRLREIDQLSAALVQMRQGLASFQKFLPTEVVRVLVSQGVEARPGGTRRPLSVLFTDLEGFTSLSEQLGDAVVPSLAEHLGAMSETIHTTGGTIDKFIGDSVMAFWGAPLDNPGHAVDACRAALACQRRAGELRMAARAVGRPAFHMRIGVNTGSVLVGNIGSDDRLNYTAIGDAVNVASRLEGTNKLYGTAIIIGEATRVAAGAAILARQLDIMAVYGRLRGGAIYELIAMADEAPGKPHWVATFEVGLAHYWERRWDEAIQAFERTIQLRGTDAPSALFIRRALEFKANPPPDGWRGLSMASEK